MQAIDGGKPTPAPGNPATPNNLHINYMKPPDQVYFEPFKIKSVEPIAAASPLTAEAVRRREALLASSHYNLFNLPAREVTIDLLTDSGTGAMSQEQWAAMMVGDESYAGAESFHRFVEAVRQVTSPDFHVIPTHQGRAAENILFYVLNQLASRAASTGTPLKRRVLTNSFFDTTAANIVLHGILTDADRRRHGEVHRGSISPAAAPSNWDEQARLEAALKEEILVQRNQLGMDQSRPERFPHGIFGGNIDLDRLEAVLRDESARGEVATVLVTVTDNTGGGLPASLENLRAIREMIDHYTRNDPPWTEGLPPIMLFLDACRFAENAYFIKRFEPGQAGRSVAEIARDMFAVADGCTMSAKKDGLANIGGFLACRSDTLKLKCWEHMVKIEGFYTYGGLAGRDMEALAVGLREGVDDFRVAQRVEQVHRLWKWLKDEGVPVKEPCGGHGVFVKGRAFWSQDGKPLIDPKDLPGQTLAVELYRNYGIRSCEIGTVMFGDYNPQTGRPDRVAPVEDFVRLAVPRRTYTDNHLEYVAAALGELYRRRAASPWKGMRFAYRPPVLPHFLSHFQPIPKS